MLSPPYCCMCIPCVCVTERERHRKAILLLRLCVRICVQRVHCWHCLVIGTLKGQVRFICCAVSETFFGLTAVTKCNCLHFDLYIRRCKCGECGEVHAICMNDAFWLQFTDVICSKSVSGDQFISPQSVCLWLYILNITAPMMQVNLKICFDVIYCPTVQSTVVKGLSTTFTHENQFIHHRECYSDCENSCIMSPVALKRAFQRWQK